MRVRIVGTRVDANEIVRARHSPTQFAIGTMKEDYLGPVSYTHLTLPTICSV